MPALRKTPTLTCATSVVPDALTMTADGAGYVHHPAILQSTRAYAGEHHRATNDAVCTLLASAYLHDRATCDHSARMVQLVEAIAIRLGCPVEEHQSIRLATLLHDIGKIAIPAAIRHKPGPLTAEEWTVMRRHPEIGQQLLQQIGGGLDRIAPIVAAHHERWDGLGYPYRLVGTAIPLSARIIAVADSFDAMTSQRPYRAPISVAAARAELLRGAGSQYDPVIISTFLAILIDSSMTLPSGCDKG